MQKKRERKVFAELGMVCGLACSRPATAIFQDEINGGEALILAHQLRIRYGILSK